MPGAVGHVCGLGPWSLGDSALGSGGSPQFGACVDAGAGRGRRLRQQDKHPGPSPRPLPSCRVFFDSCDGFFTNYNWQEGHLERMQGQAGERQADVYVGVDVFARGNVVGGRFDTNKVGGGTGGQGWGQWPACLPWGLDFLWPFHSYLSLREREAAVYFPRVGKLRHPETSVTCPKAKLCPKILTSTHFYGQIVVFIQVLTHKGTHL